MSKNILVYVKTKQDKKFNALSSLRDFTYAPNLMYAAELRHYKGKVLYSVG